MESLVNYNYFASKIAAKQKQFAKLPLYLVRGKDAQGRDCHFFIKSSAVEILKLNTIRDGVFNLEQYGDIVASGFGANPDKSMIEQLELLYDIVIDIG